MTNIERSMDMWTSTLGEIYDALFLSCEDWNPDVWNMIVSINSGMTIVASSLIVLFFFFGVCKEGISLQSLKHPETAISLLLRLAVSVGLVNVSMSLMIYIFQVIQGCLFQIAGFGTFSFSETVPEEINTALEDISIFSWDGIRTGLLGFLFILTIFILGVMLIVIVWGRFFNLYIHCAVAGCFLATLTAEPTQQIAAAFLKSYLNALFQGIIVLLALMVYTALISSDHTAAIEAIRDGDNFGGILAYAKDFLVGALLMLIVCISSENLASKMGL